jgi:hypothetical protein
VQPLPPPRDGARRLQGMIRTRAKGQSVVDLIYELLLIIFAVGDLCWMTVMTRIIRATRLALRTTNASCE